MKEFKGGGVIKSAKMQCIIHSLIKLIKKIRQPFDELGMLNFSEFSK